MNTVFQQDLNKQQAALYKALLSLTEKLAITRKELAATTGMSESSISRFYDGKRAINPHSKEGELALILVRVYRSLDALLGGNEEQCRIWLRSYNKHLQDVPVEKIKTIPGLVEVVTYLDAMRGKV